MKNSLRCVGIGMFLAGLSCMPFPVTNPEATTSLFPWLAASGYLIRSGIIAMVSGALLFGSSFLIRYD